MQEETATTKEGSEQHTLNSTTAFTTLTLDEVWQHTGKLYVRKDREKDRFSRDDARVRKAKIPYIEENLKSDWLLKYSDYIEEEMKPILLTYKASENTLKQSPLFCGVLAKETLHHTGTSADLHRIFNREEDIRLRNGWKEKKNYCPVFIRLFEAYPDVYEDLKTRDGQLVTLSYANKKLTISLTDKNYILDVETIKD